MISVRVAVAGEATAHRWNIGRCVVVVRAVCVGVPGGSLGHVPQLEGPRVCLQVETSVLTCQDRNLVGERDCERLTSIDGGIAGRVLEVGHPVELYAHCEVALVNVRVRGEDDVEG